MAQIQLPNAQTEILSATCARQDGTVFPISISVKGGALLKVCQSLLKRELVKEIPTINETAIWRHEDERGLLTLRATPLAYSALGIKLQADQIATRIVPRKGTRQAKLIEMLGIECGATIAEIAKTTGWKPPHDPRRHLRCVEKEDRVRCNV